MGVDVGEGIGVGVDVGVSVGCWKNGTGPIVQAEIADIQTTAIRRAVIDFMD